MAVGKTLRFEVFKRDGFTCQYCGSRPPDVVLELDHIDPRAAGGGDEVINLITACFDCNRGKSDKRLGDVKPRPDADAEYLRVQQEIVEAKRYLDASKVRDEAMALIIDRLTEIWCDCMVTSYIPNPPQWRVWLAFNEPDEVEYAIRRTGAILASGKLGRIENYSTINSVIKYASGIMRSRAKHGENEAAN